MARFVYKFQAPGGAGSYGVSIFPRAGNIGFENFDPLKQAWAMEQIDVARAKRAARRIATIPAAENAEIDEAIKSGEAVPAIPFIGRVAFDQAVGAILNPLPVPDVSPTARKPDFVNEGKPPPIIFPTVGVGIPEIPKNRFPAPPFPSTIPTDPGPGWDTGPLSTSYPKPATVSSTTQQVCFPVNLSGLLSGITSVASTVGSLASTYYGVRAARAGVPQVALAAPPAVVPAAPVYLQQPAYQTLAPTPAAAVMRTAAYTPGPLPIQQAAMVVPQAAGALAMAGLRGIGKIAAIAAAYGISAELVDGILTMGSPKRRRRRLLTKSDVGDISTMSALLGKNSEAFKTWLATALRR